MEQFLNKKVRYIGNTNSKIGVSTGDIYNVMHTYGSNVGLQLDDSRRASVHYSRLEIVGSLTDDLSVHSILMYNDDPVGIRLIASSQLFDIGVDSIKGLTLNHLVGFPKETLIEDGDLLVTNHELKSGLPVYDKSEDKTFCKSASRLFNL